MKSNPIRYRLIEMKGANSFSHISPQLVPSVSLGEDIFGETFGTKAAVIFLNDFKYELFHCFQLIRQFVRSQASARQA